MAFRVPVAIAFSALGSSGVHSPLPPQIPPVDYILVTQSTIKRKTFRPSGKTRAITAARLGTLYNINEASNYVIAHELGHFGGYTGDDRDDPDHSLDPTNLMYPQDGTEPDCQWCEIMNMLAK